MNLGTMRQSLRDMLEVETEDWPDALIDASIREAYERIAARETRWPFYEVKRQIPVAAEQPSFGLENNTLREVTSVRIGTDHLSYTTSDTAEYRWGESTGKPREFSRWGDDLELWPTPAADYTVSVRGYRPANDFSNAAGWEPDLPTEFHALLLDWALANEYQRQDDPEMMSTYRNKFEEQLASLRSQFMSTPTPQPIVMGGGSRMRQVPSPFPWEA